MKARVPSTSRRSPLVLGLALLLLGSPGAALHGQECPADLRGAWSGTLAAGQLLEVRLALQERAPGDYVATIQSRQFAEEVPVWHDGTRLRFQSTSVPIAFDGMRSVDGTHVDGFLQHGSWIARVGLSMEEGAETRTWATDWSPLEVAGEDLRFDLYIEDDGAGRAGGFFFFRDQRLPGLWGYGMECRDGVIVAGEKVLGLWFEGRLDPARDLLTMTVAGLGGSVS